LITLRASEAAAQCIVITPVCAFVCLGPPYYSHRAVFASPLRAFFILIMYHRIKWSSGQQILKMFGLLVVIQFNKYEYEIYRLKICAWPILRAIGAFKGGSVPKVDLTRVPNAAQRRLVDKFTDERKKRIQGGGCNKGL